MNFIWSRWHSIKHNCEVRESGPFWLPVPSSITRQKSYEGLPFTWLFQPVPGFALEAWKHLP